MFKLEKNEFVYRDGPEWGSPEEVVKLSEGFIKKSVEESNREPHNKMRRQLMKEFMLLRWDLDERPDPERKGKYKEVDFCKKFNKDFEEWKKRTGSSCRKLFIELEEERRRYQLERLNLMADKLDELHDIRANAPVINPAIRGLRPEDMKRNTNPLPAAKTSSVYFWHNRTYVKLRDYIDFLNRGGPGELTHRITEEEFKGYFYPAFTMKRNESMANQTRFEILMEEIKEYIWDAKDKVDAIHVAAVARKLYLHGTVKGKKSDSDWVDHNKAKSFNEWREIFYDFVGRGPTKYKPTKYKPGETEKQADFLSRFSCLREKSAADEVKQNINRQE